MKQNFTKFVWPNIDKDQKAIYIDFLESVKNTQELAEDFKATLDQDHTPFFMDEFEAVLQQFYKVIKSK